ncbi:MAG: hypothetical protein ABI947_14600 [Chloroflexota bacterium]
MSNILCACGEVINLTEEPNPQGFKILSESVLFELVDKIMEIHTHAKSDSDFEHQTYTAFSHFQTPGIMSGIDCPNCGRLLIYARGSDTKAALSFQLEDVSYPEKADSLSALTKRLQTGDLPQGWQASEDSS